MIVLEDGSEISTRAVIVATGAHYRRLEVENLERFEGAGVYYAATELEAQAYKGGDVVVVGGGNSAGQAALYMAQQESSVTLVVRRRQVAETMSKYLVERIDADPRIEIQQHTEVRALDGGTRLEEVRLEHNRTGATRTISCQGLFCFIGAVPATGWLGARLALDRSGFVLTDRSLATHIVANTGFDGRDPFPLETSSPGVFAAGDVRSASRKRVAAAVGEGSTSVRSVHEYLATRV